MLAMLRTTFSIAFSSQKVLISLKFVPNGQLAHSENPGSALGSSIWTKIHDAILRAGPQRVKMPQSPLPPAWPIEPHPPLSRLANYFETNEFMYQS